MTADLPAAPPPSPRRRSVPAPLAALLVTVTLVGICWALIVPAWQAPDEPDHFAYAQSLATRLALPGDPHRPLGFSLAQSLAGNDAQANDLSFMVHAVRPPWSASAFAGYLHTVSQQHPPESDGGGPNAQAVNPPLFYLYSDLAYWATGSDNLFARLYAMRAWGVSLLLATVTAAWLLAGEVLRRRRLPQLVCAAVSGLVPMETFMATSINPDALLVPLWTLVLWVGARLVRRGWRAREAVALCALTAAAILTKATSYALLPGVLAALAFAWRRRPDRGRAVAPWAAAAAALATLAVPVLAWVQITTSRGVSAVNTVTAATGHPLPGGGFPIGGFFSYVWQYYLPRLPFMTKINTAPGLAVYYVWLKTGWATFGWLDVYLAPWVYATLGALTLLVAVISAVTVARLRGARLALLGYFGLVTAALVAGLHVTAFRAIVAGQGSLLQGRYLLPVIGLFGLAVAVVVTRLPPRWRGAGAGAVLAGLLLLQVISLAAVAKAYYT